MSGSVTVPGPNNSTITQTFSNDFNSALARSIADALAAASSATNLFVQSVTDPGTAPPNTSGLTGELFIEPGFTGSITVPEDSGYSFVIDDSNGPDTIFGSPGLSIMGGGGTHTIVDPAAIVLGDTSSGSTNNVTITGLGDNVAVGNGTNVLTGTGFGTMSGGTGTNTFIESGAASYLINSQGLGDTVLAGDGATTVNSSGTDAVIIGSADVNSTGGSLLANITGDRASLVGGGGALTASASGADDTILGGGGVASVTLSGSDGLVVGSGAELSVLDTGTDDTVDAGVSFTSVTAPGGSFIRGGSGPLNFVGGTGRSTILGGSGNSTIFGGTAKTLIVGGPGGAVTYVNTTPGGLAYTAGSGNETIDASLSKGQGGGAHNSSSYLFGGLDPNGHNLLIAGQGDQFVTAGKGSDTLVGGNGVTSFWFQSANGGPAANDFVANFSSIDNVILANYGPEAATTAIAGATTSGNSTTITLSDSTKITFVGVTDAAALNGHIFST